MPRPVRTPPPLDADKLERLALRYVERFATTRAKLASYLTRKIRERGWDGASTADPAALAERMAALGYVDDQAFAQARASALSRRGLGARRVTMALREAGIAQDHQDELAPALEASAENSAITFARRRRLGPFAAELPDRQGRERAIAAFLRAGHSFDVARRIVAMAPGDPIEDSEGFQSVT